MFLGLTQMIQTALMFSFEVRFMDLQAANRIHSSLNSLVLSYPSHSNSENMIQNT
jgi:hypothetical protein